MYVRSGRPQPSTEYEDPYGLRGSVWIYEDPPAVVEGGNTAIRKGGSTADRKGDSTAVRIGRITAEHSGAQRSGRCRTA